MTEKQKTGMEQNSIWGDPCGKAYEAGACNVRKIDLLAIVRRIILLYKLKYTHTEGINRFTHTRKMWKEFKRHKPFLLSGLPD